MFALSRRSRALSSVIFLSALSVFYTDTPRTPRDGREGPILGRIIRAFRGIVRPDSEMSVPKP